MIEDVYSRFTDLPTKILACLILGQTTKIKEMKSQVAFRAFTEANSKNPSTNLSQIRFLHSLLVPCVSLEDIYLLTHFRYYFRFLHLRIKQVLLNMEFRDSTHFFTKIMPLKS